MQRSRVSVDAAIPKGVTDFLPVQAEIISHIESRIIRTFELWGFRRIIPPMLEFEQILAAGMDNALRDKSFRFEDRESNRLLAIPPDITPQIARMAVMRLSGFPLPHRLFYNGRVLRHIESQSGRSREIYQAGVELIGLDSPEADAEMIAMAVEAMRSIGLEGFKVDLGQVEFFRGIMAATKIDDAAATDVQRAVARKDVSAVAATLDKLQLPDDAKQQISALPRLFGGTEVLDRAFTLVANDRSKRALDNLVQVVQILNIHGIKDELTIDLGEIRGLAYHTGLTFEGFIHGIGEPVCGGGRYDSLMGRYGRACPATGFAFNVLNLLHALERKPFTCGDTSDSFLIFNMSIDRSTALELAAALRKQGYPVARDIIRREFGQSLEYARRMGISQIVIVGESGLDDDNVLLVRVEDCSRQTVSIKLLATTAQSIIDRS